MCDTTARVARVRARTRQLRRRAREKRAIGALSALCAALVAALAGTISALTQASPAAGPGMYGSMLLYQDAGGYVLVGVASFTEAVVIRALCMKDRNREKKRDTEEEEK